MDLPSAQAWWARAERAAIAAGGADEARPTGADEAGGWIAAPARAHAAEIAVRPDEAAGHLAACERDVPEGPWRRVHGLLACRTAVRRATVESLGGIRPRVEALAEEIPADEPATSARAWHLLGVLGIRTDRLEEAEAALTRALALVEESPEKTWILDGFAQAWLAQGAWQEARRTLEGLEARRRADDDALGLAIGAGHLANLHLQLGDPAAAEAVVRRAITFVRGRVPVASRLRLRTYLVQTLLESGGNDVEGESAALRALLEESGPERHYLKAYACVALARAAHRKGEVAAVRPWLDAARDHASVAEHRALVGYWEARLLPGVAEQPRWREGMRSLFAGARRVTEAEVLTEVLLAERAGSAGEKAAARSHLDAACDLATRANSAAWAATVDRAYRALDPERGAERLLERYSGWKAADLLTTRLEEASIVFADLVGFTPRSVALSPEEVMATVRSFFELSAGLFPLHRVRPLSYLGDGLLAVCQGEGHRERALAFARAFVRRGSRATLVRRALGNAWGLDLRAGIAAGPVVLGPLGTSLKTEYAAIGLTTNLAARLQGQAEPGEVVCSFDVGGTGSDGPAMERLHLKGFSEPVPAWRHRIEV